jgi:hypothetical protein
VEVSIVDETKLMDFMNKMAGDVAAVLSGSLVEVVHSP